jgi:hypothetical protein
MPAAWREHFAKPASDEDGGITEGFRRENLHGLNREDDFALSERFPSSDPATVRTNLLDCHNVARAILTFGKGLAVASLPNPHLAADLARAANEWTVEQWLAPESRFYGSILIANQLPDVAAKEVRRVGRDPRFVQVLMADNGLGKPFGHPLFHPIYEAAVDVGLPIALRASPTGGVAPSPIGGGFPSFDIEYQTLDVQSMMSHVVSFIAHGVFEKYRDLRLVLTEGGTAWIAPILWRFDTDYKGLRRDIPWVKRLPSEYFREHVRVTTQPLEMAPGTDQVIRLLETIGGGDILLFATDYPHWNSDHPRHVRDLLPESWHEKVFWENASKLYGWANAGMVRRIDEEAGPLADAPIGGAQE